MGLAGAEEGERRRGTGRTSSAPPVS